MGHISRSLPPLDYLNECFSLDWTTGVLIWRVRPRNHFLTPASWKKTNTQYAGNEAGAIHTLQCGYSHREVTIGQAKFKVHRIVYALTRGGDPRDRIDHINGNPLDNSPSNLRIATARENSRNRRMHSTNASGFKGVSLYKRSGRKDVFRAQIMDEGKNYILGEFATAEEAYEAYCWGATMMFGEFARVA